MTDSARQQAFIDLLETSEARAALRFTAYRIVQDEGEADDVVQEAILRAWRRLDSLSDGEKMLPWLKQIVRRQAFNRLRRPRPPVLQRDGEQEDPFSSVPDSSEPASALLDASDDVRSIARRAAELLSSAELDVFLWRFGVRETTSGNLAVHRDRSPQEIARILGKTANTVRVLLCTGLKRLRDDPVIRKVLGL